MLCDKNNTVYAVITYRLFSSYNLITELNNLINRNISVQVGLFYAINTHFEQRKHSITKHHDE